ncbi:MAG: PAC2 family protein, partial [Planctomycetota bacterium]
MPADPLTLYAKPMLEQPGMVLSFSGWMDGGEVSTGTADYLRRHLHAEPLAEIDSEEFYIHNFPGSMEVSSMFRPHTKIEDGLIAEYDPPSNLFHYSLSQNLILFEGKEPNLRWREYGDCVFSVAEAFDVRRIYFIGSVAGAVPHTRDARFSSSMSHESMRQEMEQLGIRFSGYEGPASLVTYLTLEASRREIEMAALVAEIPAYIHG